MTASVSQANAQYKVALQSEQLQQTEEEKASCESQSFSLLNSKRN